MALAATIWSQPWLKSASLILQIQAVGGGGRPRIADFQGGFRPTRPNEREG